MANGGGSNDEQIAAVGCVAATSFMVKGSTGSGAYTGDLEISSLNRVSILPSSILTRNPSEEPYEKTRVSVQNGLIWGPGISLRCGVWVCMSLGGFRFGMGLRPIRRELRRIISFFYSRMSNFPESPRSLRICRILRNFASLRHSMWPRFSLESHVPRMQSLY